MGYVFYRKYKKDIRIATYLIACTVKEIYNQQRLSWYESWCETATWDKANVIQS